MSIYSASIDDNDPQVLYSSGWVLITSDPPWTGTMHSTSVVGATASVRFTGSRAAVICIIPTGSGGISSIASFSIDNEPAVQVAVPCTPPVQYKYQFWNSGPLPMGSHLLVINNTGNENYFRLDRIDYDPTDSNAPASSASSVSLPVTSAIVDSNTAPVFPSAKTVTVFPSSAPGAPAALAASTAPLDSKNAISSVLSISGVSSMSMVSALSSTPNGPTPAPTTNSITESHVSSTSSTIKIVAGVLGGILFLVILISLIILCFRKKRSPDSQTLETPQSSDPTVPTPFLNIYTDNFSTILPSNLSDHKQTFSALQSSSIDDRLSTSGYSSSSSPPATCSDSKSQTTPQQSPLTLRVGGHQISSDKWQEIPSRTIGRPSKTTREVANLDSPPAYSGFS